MSQFGRVQSRKYQIYLMKVRNDERKRQLRGQKVEEKSVEQIRADFEEKYGTRFIEL